MAKITGDAVLAKYADRKIKNSFYKVQGMVSRVEQVIKADRPQMESVYYAEPGSNVLKEKEIYMG